MLGSSVCFSAKLLWNCTLPEITCTLLTFTYSTQYNYILIWDKILWNSILLQGNCTLSRRPYYKVLPNVFELILCRRTYEHVCDVGLFLFTDALVLTRQNVQHTPFTLAHQSTHTFLASVALTSLSVREIRHTRCEFFSVCWPLVGKISTFNCKAYNFIHVFLCRCEPCFCPRGSLPLLGLCHTERRRETALPVCAAFSYRVCFGRTSVTARFGKRLFDYFYVKRFLETKIYEGNSIFNVVVKWKYVDHLPVFIFNWCYFYRYCIVLKYAVLEISYVCIYKMKNASLHISTHIYIFTTSLYSI